MGDLEDRYVAIAEALDWTDPGEHIDALRELAGLGQAEAMNLLAILLGDIDGAAHREEIVALYERAHGLGNVAAAENLAIQYGQWNEPALSLLWKQRAEEAEVSAGRGRSTV